MNNLHLVACYIFCIISQTLYAEQPAPKVLFIDSYHQGFPASFRIVSGVKQALEGQNINFRLIEIHTKINPDPTFIKAAALKTKSVIDKFNPDILIACDDTIAREFVEENVKVPIATEHEWEMPYALVGVAKDYKEIGLRSGHATLKILAGVPPKKTPVSSNKKGKLFFNRTIAKRLGITEIPVLAEIVQYTSHASFILPANSPSGYSYIACHAPLFLPPYQVRGRP